MESAETVSYWRERALDAESELKFIKTEYGDEDSEELTRDALLLKARALESERDSLLKRIDKMMVELDVANAFHNVAVSERNAAWYEVNSLRRELDAVGATTAPLYTSQEREVLIRERDEARSAAARMLDLGWKLHDDAVHWLDGPADTNGDSLLRTSIYNWDSETTIFNFGDLQRHYRRDLQESLDCIKMILEADALKQHAFERGACDESIYETCKRLILSGASK